ncbi:aldehyde dehydrogenase family protein [Rhizobium sp. KVB221]|uniref:Aldehyde dehydrogenase n=1 Tax=Rhizobium setariae TaxID=2801340 RepID=A0A936YTT3_9HYPH|nr:aldehyde dehydrogenase family protein [Rhizobium setariae]MBL0374329.1 aldehyde dehydrogenase family protein [Rhizobium setariae]
MARGHFIGNVFRQGQSNTYLDCIDPATGEVFDSVAAGNAEDIDVAVKAARQAFEGGWRSTTGSQRGTILREIASSIVANRDRLAEIETRDNGKPLPESYIDVDTIAQIFEMYAGMAEDLDKKGEEVVELPGDAMKTTVAFRPIGVVGMITPWNFPLEQFTWKVAPALAAGCCAVVKPSEFTSLSSLELADIIAQTSLPAGVLNVVTGLGSEAGDALVRHPGVNKISFTGSTATGKRIMSAAAEDLKRVSLELGGKNPLIVFDDVDLDAAVQWVAFGAFVNQGQVCTASSRLLVHQNIADRFLKRLTELAEGIRVGAGFVDGVKMGPLVSETQFKKVMSYIEAGRNAGAALLTGGDRPEGLDAGYFIAPTVFANVTPDMAIWTEEIFGPVLSVMTFKDEDEAVRLSNDTPYGLAAAVLSKDRERAERVADALDAGITWQNCSNMVVIQAPWGGVKKSGMGRELGRWGLESFLEPKQKTRWMVDGSLGWYALPAAAE